MRRDAPLLKDGLVPVLLLRRRMRRRLETIPSSSSAGMATRGMMSKLWVLFITSGLVLRSDCEELDDARGRRLPLCPSALLSPLAKCLCPSPGERTPLPSHRSSFSSLWLRSDDDRLRLDGVEVDRCSVLLYTLLKRWATEENCRSSRDDSSSFVSSSSEPR